MIAGVAIVGLQKFSDRRAGGLSNPDLPVDEHPTSTVSLLAQPRTHAPGQLLSFAASSEILLSRAGEGQVYGDQPAQLVG